MLNRFFRRLLQRQMGRYRVPKRVQDLIPIDCLWEDGIFVSGGKFSKTFRFSDINYKVASNEDQEKMFLGYSSILNGLDSNGTAQILINNHRLNKWNFSESLLMPMAGDERDAYRREYNDVVSGRSAAGSGYTQEKYVTITAQKRNIHEARMYFSRIGTELHNRFSVVESTCTELDAVERLRILYNFYRPRERDAYHMDLKQRMRLGSDFRDYICPDSMEKHRDYLRIGDRYARSLFLKDLASFIRDDFIDELITRNQDMMLSINIQPISTEEAIRETEMRLLAIETNMANWQRRQNANYNFAATMPYDLEMQHKETKEFLHDLMGRDQRMMQTCISMVITADTKEELDRETESIISSAVNRLCQIAPLTFQQMDGLNTVLPFGTWKTQVYRTLNTESLAIFMPFKVQEIQHKGGLYFGINAISRNLITINRALLMNQSGFILGVPGCGKSFLAKMLIMILIITTNDHILIFDPEGEYAALVEALAKDISTVIRLYAGGTDRLNVMYMVAGYGEENPIASKSQFIMSLLDRIDKRGVGPQHKSVIDRCVAAVYEEGERTGKEPTLTTLREELLKQPEPIAQEIALILELFTKGSQDVFGHDCNVDLSKRITVFDIHKLGADLKEPGMLIITDTMLNRVAQNWQRSIRTHIFIDEFHVAFKNQSSADFFESVWRQFRKRNAYPTAITQNVESLLNSSEAKSMLSNSELIVMLNQAASDREKLEALLNISREQMSYVTNAEPGCGLIRCGPSLVPFENHFPRNTKLYQLMTTKPGEGVFGGDKEVTT